MKKYLGKKFYSKTVNGNVDRKFPWVAVEYKTADEVREEYHNDEQCDCCFYDDDDNRIEVDLSDCSFDTKDELVLEQLDRNGELLDTHYACGEQDLFSDFILANRVTLVSKRRVS